MVHHGYIYYGVLGAIRTPDRPLRRRMLYPLSYEDSKIILTTLLYYFNIEILQIDDKIISISAYSSTG